MKFSIRKKLFLSHIFVVLIFVVISTISLNIGSKLYIEKQTKNNLMSTSSVMAKIFEEEFSNEGLEAQKFESIRKKLPRINQLIKSMGNLLQMEYMVLNAKGKVIGIKKDDALESEYIYNALIAKLFDASGKLINSNVIMPINGVDYIANVVKISLKSNKELGYVVLFSDLTGVRDLRVKINLLLICVFMITGIVIAIFTIYLSKRISRPILKISEYAGKIANRDFEAKLDISENDEIEELSKSMQKMAESLKNHDENIKKFMEDFSHEIRTPLTSIAGYAEGIKLGVLQNTQQAVDIIIEESSRLKAYVEDVLYLSKIESNSDSYKFEKIDICDLLLDCIGRISGISIQNNKKITSNIPDKLIEIFADGEKLQRALLNILSNCIRYAKNEVILTVKENLDVSNNQSIVEITIVDDGPGFSADVADKLFDRFKVGEGGKFGLGLNIAKTIVNKHKGTIMAKNSENSGAVFTIRINKPIKESNISKESVNF